MANQIRLKRSAVQGKAPVVGDLELGELAVNTYDGKLYMKKNDGADAIVEITAAGGYTDPLTTNGDIVIRSGGTTTRLGIGSEGQALLVSSGLPVWGNVAGGYTDPLTTDGDIVIRSGGSTTRLGIGSEGQVLKVSSGLPVWGAASGGYTDPLTTDGDIVIRSGGSTTRLGIGSEGQVLKVSSGVPVWAADASGLADVVDDTNPQLGGNLDVNGNYIVSASGGDVVIAPDTTGGFIVRGNNTDGSITLNCTANTHGVTIQSPPHAAAATYTLILPNDTGTSGQVLSTNGTGTLSWLTATQPGDNVSTLTNDSGFITSTVTGDFTVDTNTLYVDSTNNRVGIVESAPAVALDVTGEIRSSTGILFGTDTAAANTLDDYEEGTWTPAFLSGTFTYGTQAGRYTKIGNLAHITCYITWSAKSGTGFLGLTSLPFTSFGTSADDRYTGSFGFVDGVNITTSYKQLVGTISGNSSDVNFFLLNDNASADVTTVQDLSSSGQMQFTITLQVQN